MHILKLTITIFITIIFLSLSSLANENTIYTLLELQKSKIILEDEIKIKTIQEYTSTLDDEKKRLKDEIRQLDKKVNELRRKFEMIAIGIDISLEDSSKTPSNNTVSEDFHLLIKPLIESAKELTKEIRKKAQLQEEIEYYDRVLPKAAQAYENIETLLNSTKNRTLTKELLALQEYWNRQITLLSSNMNASMHQVEMLDKNSISFTESLHESSKSFFQERGLFLLEGFLAFLAVIIVMHTIHIIAIKLFPIFTKANRSFHLRLFDLLYRIFTALLAIIVPMAVFYYEEDWVLFSFGLLILFGIAWTFRRFISKLWQQARLLLNIGSVREDERILYLDLPWRVKNINIFTIIENPVSGVSLRIPIEELIGLASRPSLEYEPWFPCKVGDWLLLSNDYYGKVVGISLEFIEFVDVGGGHRSYIVSDFLALSPQNLSTDFRIIDSIGIGYGHQKESTTIIVKQLESFILQKIEKEGYRDGLKKLIVQFSHAGESSLDIAIVANFNGNMAPLYHRLRRSIGRWAVEACSEYGWEIPFKQITIHNS
ncbi:hypothetical protein GSY74_07560 [Sulfurovum sp. bin170]|uniref:hypothetical protein n=1 Tax=Sulfurovum sp. bin170 TaxID=2695268 RepID=UPI0013DF3401|nr:hypothetical protein [Sulfurovum sp. bin170]NEW61135.1 hypothetical protein [Sulfurovum sp. bin170]